MMRLHDYWRSSASYRVRMALNLKGIAYTQITHNLRTGAQADPGFAMLNPQKLVPAIEADGAVLTQSLAILEWLEETHPSPALLPKAPDARATVRAMAAMIACDIHPLNNLRVQTLLKRDFRASDVQDRAWIAHWITAGFEALETLIERHGGLFAFGDTPTIADCCIVPQLYSAERFAVPLEAFPHLVKAGTAARAVNAFAAAHPDRQADVDRS